MGRVNMELTLKNEKQFNFVLSEDIAKAVMAHHGDGGIFFNINENKEMFSVDFNDVIAIHTLPTFEPTFDIKPVIKLLSEKHIDNYQGASDLIPTFENGLKELYKIECNCGAEYFAAMQSENKKCRCRECGKTVFIDTYAPKEMGDNNRPAKLATNRYRVSFIEGDRPESI